MDPSAQDLMDSARDAHEPTQSDRARVRAKLALRVGAGAAVATAAATAKATLASSWVLKLVVPVFVAAAVGGYVYTHRSPTTVQLPTATATTAEAIVEAPPIIASQVPTATATVEPTATPHVLATNAARVKAAPATSADLEAETLALAQAQSAIQRGDFTGALAKLDAEEASFPAGLLTEERIAARVVALCGARRLAEGQTLGKTFLAKYPRSPLAPRVKSACAMP